MASEIWTGVDRFFADHVVAPDPMLDAVVAASDAAGLPPHQVTPLQGQLLHLLALACGARSILEVGTLGGYSTVWLARALPSAGRLVTLELDPRHAAVAASNIERAGVADRVEVRVGDAVESMAALDGPFDLVFIDADKAAAADQFDAALALSRPGTLIVVDNVVRDGAVADATSRDPSVQGVRRLAQRMAGEARVTATAVQTVGEKGYDGFALAIVNG